MVNQIWLNLVLGNGFYILRTYSVLNCYNTGDQEPIKKTGRNRKAIRVGN